MMQSRSKDDGESTPHELGLMVDATFRWEPFGSESEVMLSKFRSYEIIKGLADQDQIGAIRIHLAVLEQRSFQVPVDKVVVGLQHAHFDIL